MVGESDEYMLGEGGGVPKDWQEACVVPVYKGRGNKNECGSYRGISMMSIMGKLYGRVVINRVNHITEGLVGEEQGGFRKGEGCVNQVFAVFYVRSIGRRAGNYTWDSWI